MANDRNAGRKPKLTPLERADVKSMHANGKPIAEIAYKYKISAVTVHRIVTRED